MDKYLMVMAGAAVGGLARYVVGNAVIARMGAKIPYGTIIVNISGCFLIGVVMTLLVEKWNAHMNWRLLLVTGVLGGYTTFSSFEYETYTALRSGRALIGMMNVFVSVFIGYLACWFGAELTRKIL